MNNRKSKFLEPLKSVMDFQGLIQMQAAVNSLLNGKMTNGQVIYSDSNVIWDNGRPPAAPSVVGPFSIYQPGDDIQIYQIRPGLVGYRSPYIIGSDLYSTRSYYQANYEMIIIGCGTDCALNGFPGGEFGQIDFSEKSTNTGPAVLIGATPTFICDTLTLGPAGVQIQIPTSASSNAASFWCVIKNTPAATYTELWGIWSDTNFSYSGGGYFGGGPFPTAVAAGDFCFPIGIVAFDGTGKSVINQYQYGHMTGRYSPYQDTVILGGSLASGIALNGINYRGYISLLQDASSAIPGYKMFFPGDILVDDSTVHEFTPGGVQYYNCYVYCSTEINLFDAALTPYDGTVAYSFTKIYFAPV